MHWVLGRDTVQSHCNTVITDLLFADDAVTLQVLLFALDSVHEEAKPLWLDVSWPKTKVQVLGNLLDKTAQSIHACAKDIETSENITYLGCAMRNDGASNQEVV